MPGTCSCKHRFVSLYSTPCLRVTPVFVFLAHMLSCTFFQGECAKPEQARWDLDTDGSNLQGVFEVEEVDFAGTVSNNALEVFEVLGIEAARQSLFNELRLVISFDGAYVNYRHMAMLVDVMTYRGHLMSITRTGACADTSAYVPSVDEVRCFWVLLGQFVQFDGTFCILHNFP